MYSQIHETRDPLLSSSIPLARDQFSNRSLDLAFDFLSASVTTMSWIWIHRSALNECSWITSRRVISFHVFQNLEKVIILAFFPYFSRFSKFESLFIWIHSFNMTPRGITWCHVIAFERLRAHFDFYPPWNKNEWISESKHLIYQNQLQDISWLVSWSRNVHQRETF